MNYFIARLIPGIFYGPYVKFSIIERKLFLKKFATFGVIHHFTMMVLDSDDFQISAFLLSDGDLE